MDFIIDILGFSYKSDYKYLPKEVAVLTLNKEFLAHWIVTPPVPYSELRTVSKLSNTWLSDNHHGIDWIEEGITLHQLHSNLRRIARVASTITVYYKEVADYLEDVVGRSIVALEKIPDTPSFSSLNPTDEFCIFHGIERAQIYRCALNNAYRVRDYVLNNSKQDGEKKTSTKSLKKSLLVRDKSAEDTEYSEVYDTTEEEPQYF